MNLLLLREAFKRTNQDVAHSDEFRFVREVLILMLFMALVIALTLGTAYVVGTLIFNNPVAHGVVISIGSLLYPILFFTYVRPFYKNFRRLKEEDRLTKQRIKEGIK